MPPEPDPFRHSHHPPVPELPAPPVLPEFESMPEHVELELIIGADSLRLTATESAGSPVILNIVSMWLAALGGGTTSADQAAIDAVVARLRAGNVARRALIASVPPSTS